MANLHYLRRVIYKLKQKYGFPVDIYRFNKSSPNPETGAITSDKVTFSINKAVLLSAPSLLRTFYYDVTYLITNRNFAYGELLDIEKSIFLIDNSDLPRGFIFTQDDFLVYDKKRYSISKLDFIDQNIGVLVQAKEVKGTEVDNIINLNVISTLPITQVTDVN